MTYINMLKDKTEAANRILEYLNLAAKKPRGFKLLKTNRTQIIARLEHFTEEDCKLVIDNQTAKWLGTEMEDYLRPSTLFRACNFEGYLNSKPINKTTRSVSIKEQLNDRSWADKE